MTTWMHEERLAAVLGAVVDSGAASVLDLGCGDGDLLLRLAALPGIDRVLGVDLCPVALDRLRARLAARGVTARVDLIHGSVTLPVAERSRFDCAVLVETIEHLDPDSLSGLERAVFAAMRPPTVIITTPNAEFNALLGVPAHRRRHPGHRFEWSRARFGRWAGGVAARAAYDVACHDIAGRHPDLGGASQMAVFRARGAPPARPPRSGP